MYAAKVRNQAASRRDPLLLSPSPFSHAHRCHRLDPDPPSLFTNHDVEPRRVHASG